MQNLYPLFERNRILKKEMLWSLRDYSFAHIQIEYQEYGQGIIRGCDIRVDGDELAVGPGILKYGRFICLMMEEEKIPYHAADRMQYLKLRIDADSSSPDYIAYRMELVSDLDEKRKENEFELCRFHLRSGARLRDHYKDFSDMGTEYDTVNLIHADWGGLGGTSLCPAVTRRFAKAVLASENSRMEDRFFACLCLSQAGAVPAGLLSAYAGCRGSKTADGAAEIYKRLNTLLEDIRNGRKGREEGRRERRRILVD